MDKIAALSLGRKLVLGAGVLLSSTCSSLAVGRPRRLRHGDGERVARVLGCGARPDDAGDRRLGRRARARSDLPDNIPDGTVTLVVGVLIFLFALLKNLTDDYSAWRATSGSCSAPWIAYGGWLVFKDSGEKLPSMSSASSGGNGTSPPPPSAPSSPPDEPSS